MCDGGGGGGGLYTPFPTTSITTLNRDTSHDFARIIFDIRAYEHENGDKGLPAFRAGSALRPSGSQVAPTSRLPTAHRPRQQ